MKSFSNYLIEKHDGSGDCMQAAANLMLRFYTDLYGKREKSKGSPVLVHALVYGRGEVKGLRFPHAWVEDGDEVIDKSNGLNVRLPKKLYYTLGKIDPNQKGAYKKYAFSDMKKKLISTGHYGPWDLDEKLEESKGIVLSRKQIGKRRIQIDPKLLKMFTEAIVTDRPTTGYQRSQQATNVTKNDLVRLETVLDSLFRTANLDVAFTRHFLERINGSRGYGGTVSISELQDAFNKTYQKYAQKISSHPVDWKAVIHDVSKDLNMPFTLDWNGKMKKMVMVTAMKKSDFKTPDPKLKV